jgi:uracil-DNA glycosylase family 4
MIVGEGPGLGEDVLGRPFIGPAGKLLRRCLEKSIPEGFNDPICLTNLLACRPYDGEPTSASNRAPLPEEIEACRPRLTSLVSIMQPSLVIAAGRVAEEYVLGPLFDADVYQVTVHVPHPSYILRSGREEEYINTLKDVFSRIPNG